MPDTCMPLIVLVALAMRPWVRYFSDISRMQAIQKPTIRLVSFFLSYVKAFNVGIVLHEIYPNTVAEKRTCMNSRVGRNVYLHKCSLLN